MTRFILLALLAAFLAPPAAAAPGDPPPLGIDGLPETFEPRAGRTEAEADRVEASAAFAYGRLLMQRQKYAEALQMYQRGLRLDPEQVSAVKEIVALALQTERPLVAGRYAALSRGEEQVDPVLLRRLALFLTQLQQWSDALPLYELAWEAQPGDEIDSSAVLMRLEMGRLYFLTEQFEKSAESFAVVADALEQLEKHGLNDQLQKMVLGEADRTYTLLSEALLLGGDVERAERSFRKLHELKQEEPLLHYNLARVFAKKNAWDRALEELEKYLEGAAPQVGGEAYDLLGEILVGRAKNPEEGRKEFRRRLAERFAEDRADVALGLRLGDAWREEEAWEKAEQAYQDALLLGPELRGYQGLALVYLKTGREEKLLEALAQGVALAGNLERLGEELTGPLLEEKGLAGRLAAQAEGLRQAGGELPEGLPLAAAYLALEAEQFELAERFFESALGAEGAERAEMLVGWGLQLFLADRTESAVKAFQRVLEEKLLPDREHVVNYYLAGALEMSGRTEEALAAARSAAAAQPDNPQMASRIPWILYHAKRYEEAEAEYRKLLEELAGQHQNPAARDTARETKLILSNLCVLTDRLPEAEEWLEQVLDEFPEDIHAHNDLGYLWADQNKRLGRSLRMITKALEAEPENVAYRDSMGWVLYRLGRFEEAVAELEKAAADEDADGVILDHLADAVFAAGDKPRAVELWRRAAVKFEEKDDTKHLGQVREKLKKHGAAK